MHKFDEGFSANNSTHYKNLLEFRNDLLNLNWKSNNIKIAVNVMKESVKNSVIDFVYSNDDLKKLLDKKNINMRLLKVTDNMLTTNEGILNEIFNFDYLLKLSTEVSIITMHKELFFLKKFQFKTFDEFKSERNKLFIEKNYTKLLKQIFQVEFESYEKKDNYDSKIELKVKESAKLRLLDVTESVNNLYLFDGDLIFTKTNKSRQVWIEAFENEESVDRLLDISLSLNGLISLFCKTSNCSLSQPKVFKLKSRGLFFFGQEINLSIQKASLTLSTEVTDAFSHFTHYLTKGKLVAIDLRTLGYKNEPNVITEPIIFSTIPNRFSSSDLGQSGIEKFKQEHSCKRICKEIRLESF
jgi:hypothetical protein